MTFSIDSAIDTVLMQTDITDVQEIARLTMTRVPDSECRAILARLLVDTVRDRIAVYRLTSAVMANAAEESAKSGKANGVTNSAKWANVRASAASIAKTWRVEGEKGYVFLGSCDVAGLAFIVSAYRKREQSNRVLAERYAALHDAMVEFNAATVADVPDEIVDKIMLGAVTHVSVTMKDTPRRNRQERASRSAIPNVQTPAPA